MTITVETGPSYDGGEDLATHEQLIGSGPRSKFRPGPSGNALIWAWNSWVHTYWRNEDLRHHPFRSLKPEPEPLEPEDDWF